MCHTYIIRNHLHRSYTMRKVHLSLFILFFAPMISCGWLADQEAELAKENAEQEKSAAYVYGRLDEIKSLIQKTGSKALVAKRTRGDLAALKSVNGNTEILRIDMGAIKYALADNTGKNVSEEETDAAEDKHEWREILRSEPFKDIRPKERFLYHFDAIKAEKALKSARVLAVFMNARVVYPEYVSKKSYIGGSYVGLIVFIDLKNNTVLFSFPLKAASSPVQVSILHGVLEGGKKSALREDFRRNIRIAAEKVIAEISGKK